MFMQENKKSNFLDLPVVQFSDLKELTQHCIRFCKMVYHKCTVYKPSFSEYRYLLCFHRKDLYRGIEAPGSCNV